MFYGDDFMVAWTPVTWRPRPGRAPAGSIEVGPWPDVTGWSDRYRLATGCCDFSLNFGGLPDERKAQILVNLFVDIVLGSGLDPITVHREFLKIRPWREMKIDLPSGIYVAMLEDGTWSPHNP